MSPVPGRSILITRAPKSASRVAAHGPARNWAKSRTSRPSRGFIGSAVKRSGRRPRDDPARQGRRRRTAYALNSGAAWIRRELENDADTRDDAVEQTRGPK